MKTRKGRNRRGEGEETKRTLEGRLEEEKLILQVVFGCFLILMWLSGSERGGRRREDTRRRVRQQKTRKTARERGINSHVSFGRRGWEGET